MLSQSTMSRSSASTVNRVGRDEGEEKEKSSNMLGQTERRPPLEGLRGRDLVGMVNLHLNPGDLRLPGGAQGRRIED